MTVQEIQSLIPQDFSEKSRVWIFQSSRPFHDREALEVKEQLEHFYLQWHAHGEQVKGWGGLLWNRFIIFMADQSGVFVSGCSTDSMERVVKSIERQYEVRLFDRLSLTFLVKGKPEVLPLNQVQYAIDQQFLKADTLLFNNTVQTKKELLESWLQPLSESWVAKQVSFS